MNYPLGVEALQLIVPAKVACRSSFFLRVRAADRGARSHALMARHGQNAFTVDLQFGLRPDDSLAHARGEVDV